MRFSKSISLSFLFFQAGTAVAFPAQGHIPFSVSDSSHKTHSTLGNHNVSIQLFAELEEFARLVDIAYCVGVTGIRVPFECASRCDEFQGYQLVNTWNTGPLMSDSCGYIALDTHGERIIVAFRGTYSITNTILDLATVPQEYVPYPGDPEDDHEGLPTAGGPNHGWQSIPWRWLRKAKHRFGYSSNGIDMHAFGESSREKSGRPEGPRCNNCTVHMGFFTSWVAARSIIIPQLTKLREIYPKYELHLVGHSLGGAVAALAALETEVLGWNPTVTTFGEPRIGNIGLREYLDALFKLNSNNNLAEELSQDVKTVHSERYRRITHINDPVPLLPLTEWGFKMHAGEIYISKPDLQPDVADLHLCDGDEDADCIFGTEVEAPSFGFPARYRMWQLFFAHRDYFWRLGLCVPGGDPVNWGKRYQNTANWGELGEL